MTKGIEIANLEKLLAVAAAKIKAVKNGTEKAFTWRRLEENPSPAIIATSYNQLMAAGKATGGAKWGW
jgi:hypothetical protein